MRLMQSDIPHDVNLIGKKGDLNFVMWLFNTLYFGCNFFHLQPNHLIYVKLPMIRTNLVVFFQ